MQLLNKLLHNGALQSIKDCWKKAYEEVIEMFHYKTIVGRGFCDIQNNQGRGKGYYTLNEENRSHVFASSLTGSNPKRANLT